MLLGNSSAFIGFLIGTTCNSIGCTYIDLIIILIYTAIHVHQLMFASVRTTFEYIANRQKGLLLRILPITRNLHPNDLRKTN